MASKLHILEEARSKERFLELGLEHEVVVHGCSLGLVSKRGNPILKPWKLMSNNKALLTPFRNCLCPRNHQHDPCAGSETRKTEGYTDDMVKRMHKGFRIVSKGIHS